MGINGTPKKRGRKPAINEEVIERLEHALRVGASQKEAAAYAGVSESVFYARKAKDQEFSDRLTRARRAGITQHLTFIAASPDWRAHSWLLSVMDPQRFTIKNRTELSGNVSFTLAQVAEKLSEARLAVASRS